MRSISKSIDMILTKYLSSYVVSFKAVKVIPGESHGIFKNPPMLI